MSSADPATTPPPSLRGMPTFREAGVPAVGLAARLYHLGARGHEAVAEVAARV